MSSQFPRVEANPTTFVPPPQTLPEADPAASLDGKLGAILNGNGTMDSGISRQIGKKMLLDDMEADQAAGAGGPWVWDEAPKVKEFETGSIDKGTAAKPKDPRLAKDKAEGKDAAEGKAEVKAEAEPKTRSVSGSETEGKSEPEAKAAAGDKPNPFDPKPYDKAEYYKKNDQHLDLGGATDWVNQKSYEQKLRDKENEAAGKAGADGGPEKGKAGNDDDAKDKFYQAEGKRTGVGTDMAMGKYVPEMRDGPLDETQVDRSSAYVGHEDVDRLNGGAGYSQTNAGLWKQDEKAKNGATTTVGMGTRADIVDVVDTGGSGTATLGASGMAGVESSNGFKAKFGGEQTKVEIGSENRAGVFGEGTISYKPVEFEPKIFGAPIDLSPELTAEGRVFNGGELGAGIKGGWNLVPDPQSGKMVPQASFEAKGSAFVGGKAEGEASIGAAGVGSVGGSAGVMYGVGVEGKAALGLAPDKDGKTHLKGELKLGASLGLGLSAGIKFDVNVDGLLTFGANLLKANKALASEIAGGVQTAEKAVDKAFSTATTKVADTARNVEHAVVDGAKAAENKVANIAKDVGNKIADGAKDVEHKVAAVAKDVEHKAAAVAKDVGNTIADGVKEAEHKVATVAKDVGDTIAEGAKTVGKKLKHFFGF